MENQRDPTNMAETFNDLRPRTLSRLGGGVAVAAVVVLSTLAFTSRAAGPSPRRRSERPHHQWDDPGIAADADHPGAQGKVAVAVKHLGSGESFRYHADEVMPTASLIKFPVMIEAYRQAADKKIDLDSFITLKKEDKVRRLGRAELPLLRRQPRSSSATRSA